MGKIIGIHGKAGSGKDTVADYLLDFWRSDFRSLAFADPIRSAMKEIFGWDDSHFQHPKKNEVDPVFNISPRKAMQLLGTEWGRNLVNDKLWLILAEKKTEPLIGAGFNVLFRDCRFENEAEWIRKNGGVIWHIERDAKNITSGAGTEKAHVSEAGIKFVKGDKRINNNETLGYLYDAVDNLAEALVNESL